MRRGFALAEVVVAITIFMFGVLGIAGIATRAQRVLASAERLESAVAATESAGDSLLAFGLFVDGGQTLPWGRVDWAADSAGRIRVVARAGDVELVVTTVRAWSVD